VFVSDHWTIVDHTVSSIDITISSDATVTQANVAALQVCGCLLLFSIGTHPPQRYCTSALVLLQEVVGGQFVAPSTVEVSLSGSTLTLSNVLLPAANPVRIFMLPYTLAYA
jgi:hypothetical protein